MGRKRKRLCCSLPLSLSLFNRIWGKTIVIHMWWDHCVFMKLKMIRWFHEYTRVARYRLHFFINFLFHWIYSFEHLGSIYLSPFHFPAYLFDSPNLYLCTNKFDLKPLMTHVESLDRKTKVFVSNFRCTFCYLWCKVCSKIDICSFYRKSKKIGNAHTLSHFCTFTI